MNWYSLDEKEGRQVADWSKSVHFSVLFRDLSVEMVNNF